MPRFKSRDYSAALLFTAATATNQVAFSHISAYTFGNVVSCSFWAKANSFQSDAEILSKQGIPSAYPFTFRYNNSNGRVQFAAYDGAFNPSTPVNTALKPGDGWVHFVGTRDGITLKLYRNSQLIGTTADTTVSTTDTTSSIVVGNRVSSTKWFDGIVSDVNIFAATLTQAQIDDLYYNDIRPTAVLTARLADGSGTTALDTSSNANNGTITGATFTSNVPMRPRFIQRNANAAILANGIDGSAGNALSIPNNASLSPTAAVTLEIWFRPTALKAGILFDNSTVGTTNSYFLSMGADGSMNWFSTIGGLSKTIVGTAKKAKFFEWNCVSATYNGSAVLIFLNGSQLAETLAASGALGTNSGPLRIGAYYSGGISATFLGNLSQPRVYAAGCTLAEHQDRYYRSITSTALQAGLVLDLNTQLGAGSTVTDLSGLGNHATMGASASWTSDSPFKARKASVNANMVKNGDFEYAPPFTAVQDSNNWMDGTAAGSTTNDLFGWAVLRNATTVAARFDPTTVYSGAYSLKVSTLDATGRLIVRQIRSAVAAEFLKYGIPVQPNTSYLVSARIKTNNVVATTAGTWVRVDATGTGIGSDFSVWTGNSSTQDWTLKQTTVTTGSTDRFMYLQLTICNNAGNISDAWYDEISITPVYPEGRVPANGNLVKNFDFEVAPTFVAATTTGGRWIDGSAAGSSTNATYKWYNINIGNFAASFDSTVFRSGLYSMKIEATSSAGRGRIMQTPFEGSTTESLIRQWGTPVLPSTSYTLSCYIKTNNAPASSIRTNLQWYDGIGTAITTDPGAYQAATQDFTLVTQTVTSPAGAQYVRLLFEQTTTGSICQAWFDDIYLAPTTNPGRIAIT